MLKKIFKKNTNKKLYKLVNGFIPFELLSDEDVIHYSKQQTEQIMAEKPRFLGTLLKIEEPNQLKII